MAAMAQAQAARAVSGVAAGKAGTRRRRVPGARKIRLKELPIFTRQMSAMLGSGMPVVKTLHALEEQSTNKTFRSVIEGVRTEIEGGKSFSEALAVYPDIFDQLYVSMMRAGETGGLLAETAARLAQYLEERAKLRREVISAMTYPVIVMGVVSMITAGLIIFVVPRFAEIYADFGAKLPGPTQMLVNISFTVRHYSLAVTAGLVMFVIGFGKFKRTDTGAYLWDSFMLRLPVFGELNKKAALARFASTFAQLMRSGVPILHALDIVAYAVGNRVLARSVMKGRDDVERGEPLSKTLGQDPNYPRMLIHMLEAGEQTGKVDEMLQKIAEFYESEVEATLAALTSLIEPLLIVFLGVTVGGVVLCMYLPIFKMHEIVAF
ncbi:MAG TPA: type II secretion system F family protein [Kiritimatiellae bacterium]|nr:type II secretion system F family protein [Kiritimatiellia bacterium]